MNNKRRLFLKGTLAGSAIAVAAGAGLLSPRQVLAAWPKGAYEAKSVPEALTGIVGADTIPGSDKVVIQAPEIAENGAVVPITVNADLKGVETITILVEKNQTPLIASFTLAANTLPSVSTRIKMAQTSNVIAVVKAGGQLHSSRKEVKVTIGGCGG